MWPIGGEIVLLALGHVKTARIIELHILARNVVDSLRLDLSNGDGSCSSGGCLSCSLLLSKLGLFLLALHFLSEPFLLIEGYLLVDGADDVPVEDESPASLLNTNDPGSHNFP